MKDYLNHIAGEVNIYGRYCYNEDSFRGPYYKAFYKMTTAEVRWRLEYGSMSPEWVPMFEWWLSLSEKTRDLYKIMAILEDDRKD